MKHTLTKYDVAGNVFLLLRTESSLSSQKRKSLYARLAKQMCAPLTGAGADGLLVISPSTIADLALDVFNADGSWAERSGNGLCAAVAFAQKSSRGRKRYRVCCGGNIATVTALRRSSRGRVFISAEVGHPVFAASAGRQLVHEAPPKMQELKIGARRIRYLTVEIGNPHAVIPVRSFPRNWVALGERITNHRRFKNGANVEFVRVVNRRALEIRIFERGVGPTASSGTGACAAVAVMKALGKVSGRVSVRFLGQHVVEQELTVVWKDNLKPIVVNSDVQELFTVQVKT